MKDSNATIIAVVSLALTLGFFGFLAYLMIRKTEPTIAQASQTAQIPKTVYVPQNSQKEKIVATEEVRPTRPHIMNHYLANANTWYEIRLPTDAITWQLKTRGTYDLLYSFEPSHSTYMTLTRGSVLTENTAPNMSIRSIYVRCATEGVTVELEVWRNHG